MDDISSAFILLAEQALQNGGKAQWGQDGYYFADGAEFVSILHLTNCHMLIVL